MSGQVLARVLVSLSSTPRGYTGHERARLCSPVSLFLSLRHRADAQDTSEHKCARPCPVCPYSCPFDSVGTPRTRASTLVLARVLISLSLTPRGCTGHGRAHWCLPVSRISVSLSLRRHTDVQDTSEHTCARPCLVCLYSCPFDTTGTPRTQASTHVRARVLISLSSTPHGRTGH